MKLRPLVLTLFGLAIGFLWWLAMHVFFNPVSFPDQMALVKLYAQKTATLNPWTWIVAESSRYVAFFWRGAYHRNMFLAGLFITSSIFAFQRQRQAGVKTVLVLIFAGMFGLLIGSPNKGAWYLAFIYPFLAMEAAVFFVSGGKAGKVAAVFLALFVVAEMTERAKFYRSDYSTYVQKIEQFIPPGATVFGSNGLWFGLYARYHFVPENLLGWQRVFQAHGRAGTYYAGGVEDFIRRQGVQYIVADDELLAWPQYQVNLHVFLEEQCEMVGNISDPYYNFSNYLNRKSPKELNTKVYRVNATKL